MFIYRNRFSTRIILKSWPGYPIIYTKLVVWSLTEKVLSWQQCEHHRTEAISDWSWLLWVLSANIWYDSVTLAVIAISSHCSQCSRPGRPQLIPRYWIWEMNRNCFFSMISFTWLKLGLISLVTECKPTLKLILCMDVADLPPGIDQKIFQECRESQYDTKFSGLC